MARRLREHMLTTSTKDFHARRPLLAKRAHVVNYESSSIVDFQRLKETLISFIRRNYDFFSSGYKAIREKATNAMGKLPNKMIEAAINNTNPATAGNESKPNDIEKFLESLENSEDQGQDINHKVFKLIDHIKSVNVLTNVMSDDIIQSCLKIANFNENLHDELLKITVNHCKFLIVLVELLNDQNTDIFTSYCQIQDSIDKFLENFFQMSELEKLKITGFVTFNVESIQKDFVEGGGVINLLDQDFTDQSSKLEKIGGYPEFSYLLSSVNKIDPFKKLKLSTKKIKAAFLKKKIPDLLKKAEEKLKEKKSTKTHTIIGDQIKKYQQQFQELEKAFMNNSSSLRIIENSNTFRNIISGFLTIDYLNQIPQGKSLVEQIQKYEITVSDFFFILKNIMEINRGYEKVNENFRQDLENQLKSITDEISTKATEVKESSSALPNEDNFSLFDIFQIEKLSKFFEEVTPKLGSFLAFLTKELTVDKLKKKLGLTLIPQDKNILTEEGVLNPDVEKLVQNLALIETPFYLSYKVNSEFQLIQILQINCVSPLDFNLYYFGAKSMKKLVAKDFTPYSLSLAQEFVNSLELLDKFQDLIKSAKDFDQNLSTSDYVLALLLFYIDHELKLKPSVPEIIIEKSLLLAYLKTQESSKIRIKPEFFKSSSLITAEQVAPKNLDTSESSGLDNSRSIDEEEKFVEVSKTEVLQEEAIGELEEKTEKEEVKEEKESIGKEEVTKQKKKKRKKN